MKKSWFILRKSKFDYPVMTFNKLDLFLMSDSFWVGVGYALIAFAVYAVCFYKW